MPDVELRIKRGALREADLLVIPTALQSIVALALNCSDKDGALTADMVEVRVTEVGPYDVNAVDVAVLVVANDFPSRKANIEERTR